LGGLHAFGVDGYEIERCCHRRLSRVCRPGRSTISPRVQILCSPGRAVCSTRADCVRKS